MSASATLLCLANIYTGLCRRNTYRSKWLSLFYGLAVLSLATRTALCLPRFSSMIRCSNAMTFCRAVFIPDLFYIMAGIAKYFILLEIVDGWRLEAAFDPLASVSEVRATV